MYMSSLECAFIDTPHFQRLRDLNQLGTAYYVFPGACHHRFEHSLGVAHLARDAAERSYRLQRRELEVERGDVTAVALAGLCHDLGHGPFSHVFERELLARAGVANWAHEDMSVRVFDAILDGGFVPDAAAFTDADAARVRAMILAGHGGAPPPPPGKRWLYELVANGRNGLDVDKFDYLARDSRATGCRIAADFDRLKSFSKVIDDETCYKWSEYQNVHEVFRARASLHQRVYTHRKAKAVEFMVVDALLAAEPAVKLAERARDVDTFLTLDDTVLRQIETWGATRPASWRDADADVAAAIAKSQALLSRLRRRDLYKFCDEFIVPAPEAASFELPTAAEVAAHAPRGGGSVGSLNGSAAAAPRLTADDVILADIPIDLTAGAANPLDRVSFFHHAGSRTKFRMRKDDVSGMLPDVCSERKIRCYSRRSDPAIVAAATAAFAAWRGSRFGGRVGSSTPQRPPRGGAAGGAAGVDAAAVKRRRLFD